MMAEDQGMKGPPHIKDFPLEHLRLVGKHLNRLMLEDVRRYKEFQLPEKALPGQKSPGG